MLFAYAADGCAAAPGLRFEHAEFVVSDATTPPQSGWQPQTLPDAWRQNHPGLTGIAWYRMRFVLDAEPTEVMALFVGRAAYTAQFSLNGLQLNPDVRFAGSSGPDSLIGDDTGRWPQLSTLPAGLLRAGENVLYIRLQASPIGGRGLWDVRIGAIEQLRTVSLAREIPQRTLPQVLFVLMAAGFTFGLLVWSRDPHTRNLHFMAVMLLWTAIVGLWITPRLPITLKTASLGLATLYIAFYWALLALFYRYSGSTWRWYPRVLHLVSAITLLGAHALIVFGWGSQEGPAYSGAIFSMMAIMRVLATVMLVQAAWRQRSLRAYALAATEMLWFAGHIQLIAVMAGWLPPVPFRLEPACSLPLYLVLLYFFIDGLIRERDEAIRQQHAAITTERARILQDMHDGMGAQLVTALRLAQRQDFDRRLVARSIEEALQDMRIVIDSLDVSEHGLAAALANLRYRLESRLAALGIRLDWQVPGQASFAKLTPTSVLGILRIVQEAINNAVKHAQPRAIAVAATLDRGYTVIAVSDDGIGFDVEAVRSGHGLSGMHKRAEALGGALCVSPREEGGTRVTLRLPTTSHGQPASLGSAPADVS